MDLERLVASKKTVNTNDLQRIATPPFDKKVA